MKEIYSKPETKNFLITTKSEVLASSLGGTEDYGRNPSADMGELDFI